MSAPVAFALRFNVPPTQATFAVAAVVGSGLRVTVADATDWQPLTTSVTLTE